MIIKELSENRSFLIAYPKGTASADQLLSTVVIDPISEWVSYCPCQEGRRLLFGAVNVEKLAGEVGVDVELVATHVDVVYLVC